MSKEEIMASLAKAARILVPIAMIGGVLSAAVSASAATATPASPQVAAPPCTSSYLCFWVNVGYSGERGQVSGNNSNFANLGKSSGGNWNDIISSAYNDGQHDSVALYQNVGGYAGENTLSNWSVCFALGHGNNNFVAVPDPLSGSGNFNDQASSNAWFTGSNSWCGDAY
jgi:Peptidase inhibitor family I36